MVLMIDDYKKEEAITFLLPHENRVTLPFLTLT